MDRDTVAAVVDRLGDAFPESYEDPEDLHDNVQQKSSLPQNARHGLTHSYSNLSIGLSVLPGQPKLSLTTFATASSKILEDFLESNSPSASAAAIEAFKRLNCAIYHDTLVVKAIQSVLTQEEEVQAKLASFITLAYDSKLITRPQVTRAFEKLIQKAESLHGEVEDVEDKLFNFFVVAADDGVIDRDFMARLPEALLRQIHPNICEVEPHLLQNIKLLKEYKRECAEFMPEFFDCGEVDVVQHFFKDLETKLFKPMQDVVKHEDALIPLVTRDLFRHEFVRRTLVASLSRPNLQKELVSKTLSDMYGSGPDQLSPDDIQLGVLRLLASVQDLSLDCPRASEIISNYIVRMTVDDILPPAFISDFLRLHLGDALGVETLRRAFKWMTESAKHHLLAERFQKVWTGTDEHRPEVEEFKRALRDIIFDFFNTADITSAIRYFNQLEMSPDQEVEAIRKIVVFALERQQEEWLLAVTFLEQLMEEGEIDGEVVLKGFQQIEDKLSDIELDSPQAMDNLRDFFVPKCIERGLLPHDFKFKEK